MMDLEDEARVFLELARDSHDPSDADRARVQAALAARLGAVAGLGLAAGLGSAAKVATATSTGVSAGTVGVGVAVKLVSAVVLISATVGVGVTALHHTHHAPVASVALEKQAPPPRARATAAGSTAPAAAPEVPALARPTRRQEEAVVKVPTQTPPAGPIAERPAPPTHAVVPARGPANAPVSVPARASANTVAAAPTNTVDASDRSRPAMPESHGTNNARVEVPARGSGLGVADEARLIHAAVAALRSGQPAQALSLFDAHAAFYPHGVLADERDAERALALADLGRVAEARAAIDQFLRTHPTSPLAARLRERLRDLSAGD